MARPLPPKSDTGFWSLVDDFNGLVRLARAEEGKSWKGERLTVARDLAHALDYLLPDVERLKDDLCFSVAFWSVRGVRKRYSRARLKEIGRRRYAERVEALVGRHKGYLAEKVLSEEADD